MNQYPKRLIEVDLPIKRISAHARREKSIRHGHISTLHIWWARRPLAACRAVICASLWFDPADEKCPESFREAARDKMRAWGRESRTLMSSESYAAFEKANKDPKLLDDNVYLRGLLLDFIADFANWDNSTNEHFLETSQTMTDAAHIANGGEPGTRPLVVDPFAGGGAIPLEALRVGADAFASDLNPIAVLLNKVILEYIPKYGTRLADEVRKCGKRVKEQAEKKLGAFYPRGSDGSIPIAYIWARTIKCEGPGCGTDIPLLRTLKLTKSGRKWQLHINANGAGEIDVEIREGSKSAGPPTVTAGKAVCPRCGHTTAASAVKAQLSNRHGGTNDARLVAVYVQNRGGDRSFRSPESPEKELNTAAHPYVDVDSLPNEIINPIRPYKNSRGLSAVTRIGITRFRDLYSWRQALVLQSFRDLIKQLEIPNQDPSFEVAVRTVLNCALSKFIPQNCTLARWDSGRATVVGAFGKQALQITSDFAEVNPINDVGGSWSSALDWVDRVIQANLVVTTAGRSELFRAQQQVLPDDSVDALITDPPYFAAIPYADLSNVFYVWERDFIRDVHPNLFTRGLVNQEDEIIVTNANPARDGIEKSPEFFETEMRNALSVHRRSIRPNGVAVIVFADSATDSWEAILNSIICSGWYITGSWPIDTELQNRTQASESASLQSSVHVVCRPREDSNGELTTEVGDWRDVLRDLPIRIHEWMPRLAEEGVVGADAIFACLGPALEIFSRYSSVEKPNGETVALREYLEHVWAAVAKEALKMIFAGADATGFEEDARLTAMWLWTLFSGMSTTENSAVAEEEEDEEEESGGGKKKASGYVLEYDAARKIAQGLGANLGDLDSIIEVKGDKARLLPVSERARDLFGYVDNSATETKRKTKAQKKLFEEMEEFDYESTSGIGGAPEAGATTLDRIHQTMLLFSAGRSEAVRRFLVDDGVGNDERFWRLANALSALYPSGTDEKRWVDGVLARKKGLGF